MSFWVLEGGPAEGGAIRVVGRTRNEEGFCGVFPLVRWCEMVRGRHGFVLFSVFTV